MKRILISALLFATPLLLCAGCKDDNKGGGDVTPKEYPTVIPSPPWHGTACATISLRPNVSSKLSRWA